MTLVTYVPFAARVMAASLLLPLACVLDALCWVLRIRYLRLIAAIAIGAVVGGWIAQSGRDATFDLHASLGYSRSYSLMLRIFGGDSVRFAQMLSGRAASAMRFVVGVMSGCIDLMEWFANWK